MGGYFSQEAFDKRKHYGLFEYYLDEDRTINLSNIIYSPTFRYNTQIPLEYSNGVLCSYLHLAVQHDSATFVRLWITCGFPIDILDNRGWSALHWAVYYDSKAVFSILMLGGIDFTIKTVHIFKQKHNRLLDKTAIEMAYLLERTTIHIWYSQYKKHKSDHLMPLYRSVIDPSELLHIPFAITESYAHLYPEREECLFNSCKFILIYEIGKWKVYETKYGVKKWFNTEILTVTHKCPAELHNIPCCSTIQVSTTGMITSSPN